MTAVKAPFGNWDHPFREIVSWNTLLQTRIEAIFKKASVNHKQNQGYYSLLPNQKKEGHDKELIPCDLFMLTYKEGWVD